MCRWMRSHFHDWIDYDGVAFFSIEVLEWGRTFSDFWGKKINKGSRDGAVVRALASHQCGPGSIPGLGVICGLSLLLVLVPAPRVFLRVLRFSSLHKNQHFQIPIRPGNSGKKSHPVESTEISIYYYYYYLLFIYYLLSIYLLLRRDSKWSRLKRSESCCLLNVTITSHYIPCLKPQLQYQPVTQ